MDTLQTVIEFILTDASVIALIGIAVSLLLQPIKKWLSLQSDKVVTLILTVMSISAATIELLLSAAAANPELLGAQSAGIFMAANLAYRYLIKPATNIVNDAKELRAQQAVSNDPTLAQPVAPVVPVDEPQAVAPVSTPVNF